MNYGILPTLDKKYILSKITQEQIFEKYLGITVVLNTLMVTPSMIRTNDKDPTFSFKYSDNGKLRAREWAGYFWGDCFDLVGHVLRLDATTKKGFSVILDTIARDFKLHKYQSGDIVFEGSTYDVREAIRFKHKSKIEYKIRAWNKQDADFWLAGNITKPLLELGRVFPCEFVWLDNRIVYNYSPKDPAYAYHFTPDEVKIYYPKRTKYRFLSNSSYIQGIDLFKCDRFGIITKSYKDVLSLKSFGIQAIAPSSETAVISKKDWNRVNYKCDFWFSLMDYDKTGIKMAWKLRKLYNVHPLFLANEKHPNLSKHYPKYSNVKDFYDLVKVFHKQEVTKIIDETKELFEEQFTMLDNYYYNKLLWI